MLKQIFLFSIVLNIFASTPAALADVGQGQWVRIAETSLEPGAKSARIDIGDNAGRLSAIRLYLPSGKLKLDRVAISYGNGQVHFEDRSISLHGGQRTMAIDPREEFRFVDRVSLTMAAQSSQGAAKKVEVWGLSEGSNANLQPASANGKVAGLPATKNWAKPPEVMFGAQSIGFGVDRDTIAITKDIGKFDRIRLGISNTDIHINGLKIVYADGATQAVAFDDDIAKDGQTDWIAVDREKFIKEIQLAYRADPRRTGQARVEAYGQYADAWFGPFGEGLKYNDGWVLLGAQKTGMVGFDRDSIAVGGKSQGFDQIRITAKEKAVTLNNIRVVYDDGTDETIAVKTRLDAGATSDPLPIKGRSSSIVRIEPRYRSRFFGYAPKGNNDSTIEVWGAQSQQGMINAPIARPVSGSADDEDTRRRFELGPYTLPDQMSPPQQPVTTPQASACQDVCAEVPVLFGTNRQREDDREIDGRKLAAFSGTGRDRLEIGQAIVTIPTSGRQKGEVSTAKWDLGFTQVAFRREDKSKDFTLQSIEMLGQDAFVAAVKAQLDAARNFKNHAFVFVHGYNVSFDDAVFRTAQISYDLGFDGPAFLYTWPSNGGMASYGHDLKTVMGARDHLRKFLELISSQQDIKEVHLIAHSMGAQLLLEVLRDFNMSRPAQDNTATLFKEIILAAPDVTQANFKTIAEKFKSISHGVTLYASSNDRALQASEALARGEIPAGYVPKAGPLVMNGVETIDVSAASTDFFSFNHSTFADRAQILKDMKLILKGGVHPPDKRFPIYEEIKLGGGSYWKYEK